MTSVPASDQVNEFIDKLAALGGEILDAAKPALHVATEATLTAIQMRGIAKVAEIGLSTVIAAGALALAVYLKKRGTRYYEDRQSHWDERHIPWHVSAIAAFAASAFFATNAFLTSIDASTWMALFRPDAYLAAKALGL